MSKHQKLGKLLRTIKKMTESAIKRSSPKEIRSTASEVNKMIDRATSRRIESPS